MLTGRFPAFARVLPAAAAFLGLRPVMDGPGFYYCVAAAPLRHPRVRTGASRRAFRAAARRPASRLLPGARAGRCDQLHRKLLELAPLWFTVRRRCLGAGLYSVLFEDLDAALELNHVPGQACSRTPRAAATADALP